MLLLWLLACDDISDTAGLIAPVDGVVATTPWIPIQFEILRTELTAPPQAWLDGIDVTDPYGFTRSRAKKWGGNADYLATLDLRGVAPGEHVLHVHVGERVDTAAFTFEPAPCRVDAWIQDAEGEPMAGQVVVFYEGHRVVLGNEETAIDPRDRDLGLDRFMVLPDRGGSAYLPCRTYTFMAAGDVRREVALQTLTLEEGVPARVDFVLPVGVETPGEHSADLHVHTGRSQDGFLADQPRVESIAGAGVEVVVITDHDRVNVLGPTFQAILGDHSPVVIQGVERDLHLYDPDKPGYRNTAHFNAFPLALSAELPPEQHDRVETFMAGWASLVAGTPSGIPVVQLNHPRGIQFQELEEVEEEGWALFNHLGFDHDTPPGQGENAWMAGTDPETGVQALAFDTLEVLNRASLDRYRDVRADWFALLGHGMVFTGTGNSDSHGLVIESAGRPINLVQAPLPDSEEALAEWLAAVVEGRVRVTNGPVVGLELDGDVARVRVQAASWVPVHQIRLVVNGLEHVVVQEPIADAQGLYGPTDLIHEFPLELDGDTWLVAEAGWPLTQPRDREQLGLFADVAPDHVPIGFTNPVFVDHDGDGVWTPPGVP